MGKDARFICHWRTCVNGVQTQGPLLRPSCRVHDTCTVAAGVRQADGRRSLFAQPPRRRRPATATCRPVFAGLCALPGRRPARSRAATSQSVRSPCSCRRAGSSCHERSDRRQHRERQRQRRAQQCTAHDHQHRTWSHDDLLPRPSMTGPLQPRLCLKRVAALSQERGPRERDRGGRHVVPCRRWCWAPGGSIAPARAPMLRFRGVHFDRRFP